MGETVAGMGDVAHVAASGGERGVDCAGGHENADIVRRLVSHLEVVRLAWLAVVFVVGDAAVFAAVRHRGDNAPL